MKRLLIILIGIMLMAGCANMPIQIKANNEILAPVGFAARMAAIYVKAKYQPEVDTFLRLADQVVNANTDALLEERAQIFFNQLISKIKDPEGRIAAQAFLNSFEIDIDTSQIVFDLGARQTVRDAIKIFRDILAGV